MDLDGVFILPAIRKVLEGAQTATSEDAKIEV
jgi:hypothetical protein